ncbi:MAG: TetR/AcrR family transcriptional regulator [Sandaracinaceae bacterium]
MGKGAETRLRILDRALGLASTEGLEGLTLGHLAHALGMSKSGLFAHFQSKEQLQIDVLREAEERFVRLVVKPAIKQPRGEPRIRAMFENWLAWETAFPGGCIFQAVAPEVDDRPGPLRDYLVRTQADWFRTMIRAAEIAQAEGHFDRDLDPRQLAFEVMSLFLGFHRCRRLFRDGNAEAHVRRAFDDLLDRARAGAR